MIHVIMRGHPIAAKNGAASSSFGSVERKAASSFRNSTGRFANAGRSPSSSSVWRVRSSPRAMHSSSATSTPLKPVLEASLAKFGQESLPPIGTPFNERYIGTLKHYFHRSHVPSAVIGSVIDVEYVPMVAV